MKHQRNVEGLRQNALKKRQEAFDRVEAAIKQLIKENRSINFKTVAEVAEVSTAWLYKEPEIKSRIEHLREAGTRKQKSVPSLQKATDASKDAKYQTLKRRVQDIEAENRGLREHLEAIHGRQRVLADENEVLLREVERLTKSLSEAYKEVERLKQKSQLLQQCPSNLEVTDQEGSFHLSASSGNVPHKVDSAKEKITAISTRKSPSTNVSTKIQAELDTLEIQLNLTLKKTISSVSEKATLLAIEALKEAQSKAEVPNPAGFLVRAIKEEWIP
ncbi:hypothetical protein PI95_023635 [Hassallia byssoidea VB512170]|uniref:Transposase n=1 Tax=Hassallia byssoidea VB512170 TaxID=1304833 RepID=A0A846HD45_9CYAN|nr:DUF6262 family protein [Hassalia byssoidea]NEU75467.1 hypothetical protein [Hassalia byssoidea VB512170]